MVRELNTLLTLQIDPPNTISIKNIWALSDTLDEMDTIDIYGAFHARTSDYTFFYRAYGTFSSTAHILGHKTSLEKLKKIESIPSIFPDHSALKVKIN